MSNTAANVSTGKPKTTGAIFRAPLGSKIPTSATEELSSEYACLGYTSDDGLTNSNAPTTGEIKAWGGDTVLVTLDERADTFSYTMLEVLNIDVLKAVYGDDNVSGDLSSGIVVKANSTQQDDSIYVIDMIMNSGCRKRIVIPDGALSNLGDISYVDNEAVGYEVTITAIPDADGNTHYEYIQKADSASPTSLKKTADAENTESAENAESTEGAEGAEGTENAEN